MLIINVLLYISLAEIAVYGQEAFADISDDLSNKTVINQTQAVEESIPSIVPPIESPSENLPVASKEIIADTAEEVVTTTKESELVLDAAPPSAPTTDGSATEVNNSVQAINGTAPDNNDSPPVKSNDESGPTADESNPDIKDVTPTSIEKSFAMTTDSIPKSEESVPSSSPTTDQEVVLETSSITQGSQDSGSITSEDILPSSSTNQPPRETVSVTQPEVVQPDTGVAPTEDPAEPPIVPKVVAPTDNPAPDAPTQEPTAANSPPTVFNSENNESSEAPTLQIAPELIQNSPEIAGEPLPIENNAEEVVDSNINDLEIANVKAETSANNDILAVPSENEVVDESSPAPKTPFKYGATPGQSSNNSAKDEPPQSTTADTAMIVGVSVAIVVICIIGFVVFGKNRKKSSDMEENLSEDTDSTRNSNNLFASKGNTVNQAYDASGAIFAPQPLLLNPGNNGYENHILAPDGSSYQHSQDHVNHMSIYTDTESRHDTSYSMFLQEGSATNEIGSGNRGHLSLGTILSEDIVGNNVSENHESFITESSYEPMAYSMFLQEQAEGIGYPNESNELKISKKDAHLSLGTIMSESSVDRAFDQGMEAHQDPMSSSSIITSMNYESVYSTQVPGSELSVYSLAEQAKRAAGTEGFQRDNIYESML